MGGGGVEGARVEGAMVRRGRGGEDDGGGDRIEKRGCRAGVIEGGGGRAMGEGGIVFGGDNNNGEGRVGFSSIEDVVGAWSEDDKSAAAGWGEMGQDGGWNGGRGGRRRCDADVSYRKVCIGWGSGNAVFVRIR